MAEAGNTERGIGLDSIRATRDDVEVAVDHADQRNQWARVRLRLRIWSWITDVFRRSLLPFSMSVELTKDEDGFIIPSKFKKRAFLEFLDLIEQQHPNQLSNLHPMRGQVMYQRSSQVRVNDYMDAASSLTMNSCNHRSVRVDL